MKLSNKIIVVIGVLFGIGVEVVCIVCYYGVIVIGVDWNFVVLSVDYFI